MSAPTEQQRDQLLDYLYDALPDADRASLEAALASSEPLRRELAALRETLSMTRKALAETEREPPSGVREAVLRAAQAATEPAPITETPRLWATLIGWLQSHARLTTLSVLAVIGLAVLSRRDPQHVLTPPLTPSAPDVLQEFAPTPAAPAADSVSPTREIEPTRATVPASPESVPPV
jgi:anti-sigma factor RsiW